MPSSAIRWMRYERALRSLLIAYQSGTVYRYFDVPATAWEAFRGAASKGGHLNTVFKDGGYGFERVARPAAGFSHKKDDPDLWGEPV